jgi:hypothetical protein
VTTAYAAKTVARIFKRTEMNIYVVLRDQFGFRREGIWDATGVLRIISEQTLDIDEEMCACFTDW